MTGEKFTRTHITWNDGLNRMTFDAVLQENFNRTADVTAFPVEHGSTITDHVQVNQWELTLEVHVSDTPIEVPRDHIDDVIYRLNADGTRVVDADGNYVVASRSSITGEKKDNTRNADGTGFLDVLDANPPPSPSFALQPSPFGRTIQNVIANRQGRAVKSAKVLMFEGGRVKRVVNVFDQLEKFLLNGELLEVHTKLRPFGNMVIRNIDASRDANSGSGMVFTIDMVQVTLVEGVGKITGGGVRRLPTNPGKGNIEEAGGETEEVPAAEQESVASKLSDDAGNALRSVFGGG